MLCSALLCCSGEKILYSMYWTVPVFWPGCPPKPWLNISYSGLRLSSVITSLRAYGLSRFHRSDIGLGGMDVVDSSCMNQWLVSLALCACECPRSRLF